MLKNNANLGRLNISSVMGKLPGTNIFTELYSFGTRSFSIRDANGALIFDSGDDFEWITARVYPTNFNPSNNNTAFDDRSDDKRPEPEGVVVGKAFGNTYAFIGLERIGEVVAYDVSNPHEPFFVDYVNCRNFTVPANMLAPATRDRRD